MAELFKVGDVDQSDSRKRESPHLGAGLGKRAGLASCVSRATLAASRGEINLASEATEGPGKERTPLVVLTSRASRRRDPKPKHDRPPPWATSRRPGRALGS